MINNEGIAYDWNIKDDIERHNVQIMIVMLFFLQIQIRYKWKFPKNR